MDDISFSSHILNSHQVDMRKVNLTVIRPWIAKKVTELVGFEDEVVVEYAMGLLEDQQEPVCLCNYFIATFGLSYRRHQIPRRCR